jgi:hypothetical protein
VSGRHIRREPRLAVSARGMLVEVLWAAALAAAGLAICGIVRWLA